VHKLLFCTRMFRHDDLSDDVSNDVSDYVSSDVSH